MECAGSWRRELPREREELTRFKISTRLHQKVVLSRSFPAVHYVHRPHRSSPCVSPHRPKNDERVYVSPGSSAIPFLILSRIAVFQLSYVIVISVPSSQERKREGTAHQFRQPIKLLNRTDERLRIPRIKGIGESEKELGFSSTREGVVRI